MRGIKFPRTSAVTSARVEKIVDALKSFLQVQLDEIRENKLRFGLIVATLIVVIIIAALDFETGEEIQLDAQDKSVSSTQIAVTSDSVKPLIGASSDEIFIQDPFKVAAQIDNVEPLEDDEKILPPVPIPPVIFETPKVEDKVPTAEFILQGIAVAEDSTALFKKIFGGKVETLFLKIGDKVNDKIIVEIGQNFVTLEDGEKIFITP